MVAGLFGLSAVKGKSSGGDWPKGTGDAAYDCMSPLLLRPASEWTPKAVWVCTNRMRLLMDQDGMSGVLQQLWICYPPGEPTIEEWRPIEMVQALIEDHRQLGGNTITCRSN
jgi:hypothetical protein